ncbi:MAG TPA: hypothetical protein VL949_06245 [Geobacteraceae bacterium]|jgi:hypothetical protein|nr:hypothetical protein [Geobacteraceae bacterium]
MAVLVHFKNNDFGYVEDKELDTLIEKDAIYAFKLASGWVKVCRGSSAREHYHGHMTPGERSP